MSENLVDIKENYIRDIDDELLYYLLKDHSTGFNIIWATDNYADRGSGYSFDDHIQVEAITGENGDVIRPRVRKSKEEQSDRVKKKAEVFTPAWVCNAQNNLIDDAWFGRHSNRFNKELGTTWESTYARKDANDQRDRIKFPKGKSWMDYVKSNRLEVSCGEAPYITSRYDAVTGRYIKPKNRIGILDRKLRVITENVSDKSEWQQWAEEALKSTYGFEWQGDNLLLARENVLFSVLEYHQFLFKEMPSKEQIIKYAEIISWNLWQMDGIKCVVPNSCHMEIIDEDQFSLFESNPKEVECPGCRNQNIKTHNGIYAKIKDWETGDEPKYKDLILEGGQNNA